MIRQCRRWLGGALVALVAVPGVVRAQVPTVGTITGRVVDATSQQPVASATVAVVGTQRGTLTAPDGTFRLVGVVPGQVTVRVQRIGYAAAVRPLVVTANETATLNVALAVSAVQLSEVVTTATGTQRRIEIGNAISNVNASQVAAAVPTRSVGDLLTARAPGVQVLPNSFAGAGARVRIRGTSSLSLSNDPIYIIDGVRMTSNSGSTAIGVGGTSPNRVGDINPDEIENIEVVKGPSAATLYGTDAANGVVLITTKRGAAGRTRFNVYTEQGLVQNRNDFPTAYTLFGRSPGAASVTQRTNCRLTDIAGGLCTADSVGAFNVVDDDDTTPFATGYRNQYGLNASGGTSAVTYYTSAEYEAEQGVFLTPEVDERRLAALGTPISTEQRRPNNYERASFRVNLNAAATPKLDLGLSSGYIASRYRAPQSDNNITGLFLNALGGPGFRDSSASGLNGYASYPAGDIFQDETRQQINRFIGSANLNYRPLEWLTARANVGTDITGRVDSELCRRGNCANFATYRTGFAQNDRANIRNTTVDLGTTATFDFNENVNSRTTLGGQYINYRQDQNQAYSENLPPGAQTVSGGAIPSVFEATNASKTLGLFLEEALSLGNRLFLTGAVRTDQNSAFGTDFQRVVYPKASVSYVISEEGFFPRASWFDRLRLRAAYGAAGTQPQPNDALQFFSESNVNIGGVDAPALQFNALGNPDLRPERATEFEGGFETQLFGSRLSVDLTYYSKLTKDALIARVIAPSIGAGGGTNPVTTRLENLGSVKNAGLEALVTAQLLNRPSIGWDVTVNGSTNANKLVDLGGVPTQVGTTFRQAAGFPLNGYWQRKISGYSDVNGDGIIAVGEVVVDDSATFVGYSIPRHEISLTNGFDLFNKSLRVTGLVDYKGGHRLYNNTERFRCQSQTNCAGRNNPDASLFEQARQVALTEDPARTFAGYMEKADFIRFRELSLTYRPSQQLLSRIIGARENTSITFAARNLGVWTKYSGIDPETNYNSGGNAAAAGELPQDFFTLPPQSYYSLRVNFGF